MLHAAQFRYNQRAGDYFKKHCKRLKRTEKLIDKKTGRTIKAILPVHVFGNPCDMGELMDLAHEYDLHVIEDACEAIGAEFEGKKLVPLGGCRDFWILS